MKLLWQAPARSIAFWWSFLALAGVTNITLWFVLYRAAGPQVSRIEGGSSMLVLSACYVFGCAFRSILPRADVQRFCLFDTWLSSIVVGRSVATVAEVAFAAQWALILQYLGRVSDAPAVSQLAHLVVPMIVVAQICSWYGVLTTNTLANAIENSIWAVTFALIGSALLAILPQFDGVVFWTLAATIVGIACYLVFLVTIDIPMYLKRRSSSGEQTFLGLADGVRDATFRRIVTHDFAHWRQEIPWQTLYFTVAVWMSLALGFGYTMRHEFSVSRSAPEQMEAGQKTSAISDVSPTDIQSN